MKASKKTLRICPKGHSFYKSSECPSCPVCAAAQKPDSGFLSLLGAPARRALESIGVQSLDTLGKFSQKEILALHGMGPASMPILLEALDKGGLKFKNELPKSIKPPVKKQAAADPQKRSASPFKTVTDYIETFTGLQKKYLQEMRQIIKQAAPKTAEEVISYNMPAIRLQKVLVYFAANKNHLGFYPTNGPIKKFESELQHFTWSKGAVQFPFDKPLPKALIKKMVGWRVLEEEEKTAKKSGKPQSSTKK